MSGTTVTHRALIVPEILRLIFELLDTPDLARLLSVSRRVFTSAMPLVWHSVSNERALLRLLPNVKITGLFSMRIDKFQLLGDHALSRFNLYTPHIKVLTAFLMRQMGPYNSWEALLSLVPNRPLFPNLRRLRLESLNRVDYPISLIDSLVCSTLVELRSPLLEVGCLKPDLASQLATKLAQSCRNVHTLDLYTQTDPPPDNFSESDSENVPESNNRMDLSPLLQLPNLCRLACGPEALSPDVFGIIASLPVLESLEIYVSHRRTTPISFRPAIPPPNGFSMLQHLAIDYDYEDESTPFILQLWNIQPIVQRLVSVYIAIDPAASDITSQQICQLICVICQHSPRTTDLYLHFQSKISESETFTLSPAVVSHLKQLPLQRLHMMGVDLGQTFDWRELVPALIDLEYLKIDRARFGFKDLKLMAKYMPKLRFLAIQLDLRGWPTDEPLTPGAVSSYPLYFESDFRFRNCEWSGADMKAQRKHAESMASFLHGLWPKGVHCAFRDSGLDAETEFEVEILHMVNTAIQRLCSPTDLNATLLWEDAILRWKHVERGCFW